VVVVLIAWCLAFGVLFGVSWISIVGLPRGIPDGLSAHPRGGHFHRFSIATTMSIPAAKRLY